MIENLPDGLRVVRRVRAPRDDAFDAWVNPQRLPAWFGPRGTTVVAVQGELRVGKDYRLHIRHDDGRRDQLTWTFREIAPPERLVFGWSVGADPKPEASQSIVSITFREAGGFTEIELRHTAVATDQERHMFAIGWQGCFVGLEELLHHMV